MGNAASTLFGGEKITTLINFQRKTSSSNGKSRTNIQKNLAPVPGCSSNINRAAAYSKTAIPVMSTKKSLVYGCPICDEPLESPAPNYDETNGLNSPVVVVEAPVVGTTGRRLSVRGRKAAPKAKSAKLGNSAVTVTPCGHLFHTSCIDQWFKNAVPRSCPSCRKICTAAKMIPIFPVVLDRSGDNSFESLNVSVNQGPGPSSRNEVITIDEHGEVRNPPPVVQQNNEAPNGASTNGNGTVNAEFEELKTTHQTLLQDYNQVTSTLNDKMDELALQRGISSSYEIANEKLNEDNAKLKQELAALLEAKANEAQTTAAAAASQVSSNSNGNGGVEPKAAPAKRGRKRALPAPTPTAEAVDPIYPNPAPGPAAVAPKRRRGPGLNKRTKPAAPN